MEAIPKLSRFHRLPGPRKLMLAEAGLLLPLAWLLVRGLPFRWWSPRLGAPVPGEATPSGTDDERARDIAWAVMAINRRVGGRFTCLMLAMAAQWMLNHRRISSSLVLGTRTEHGEDRHLIIKAHAWLRVGSQLVVGHHGGQFTAVSSFVRRYDRHGGSDPR